LGICVYFVSLEYVILTIEPSENKNIDLLLILESGNDSWKIRGIW